MHRFDTGRLKGAGPVDASVTGASGLRHTLTDLENRVLTIRAAKRLRTFNVYGPVVWGGRTLRGYNEVGTEWKYIPVRRLALFLEESLHRGTK